jgi:uncharacterized protein with GYD domain
MPKFLYRLRYNASGLEGTLKDGFATRAAYAGDLARSLGGTMESFYWAYGDDDAVAIADMPDAAAAVGLSIAVNRSGAISLTTTPLLTPAEMDAAAAKQPDYRAPGLTA